MERVTMESKIKKFVDIGKLKDFKKSKDFKKFGFAGANGTTFGSMLALANGRFFMYGIKRPLKVSRSDREVIRTWLIDAVNWYHATPSKKIEQCQKAFNKNLEKIWGHGVDENSECSVGKDGKVRVVPTKYVTIDELKKPVASK